jgi:hypothetical protein
MAGIMLPDARFRSPTAVEGKSDLRDEYVYSAIVVQSTATGVQKVFTVPQGQAIPKMSGSSTVTTQTHQQTYSETTTNLTKAGELGSSIGDASIRGIGINFEAAAYTPATGVQRAFGATQFEVADINAKCFFQLKIAGKQQTQAPVFAYPAVGGLYGSIGSTGNAATVSAVSNGLPGASRALKLPILVARNDTLEGVFGVSSGAALAFSTGTGDVSSQGQPLIIWFVLKCLVSGDVR